MNSLIAYFDYLITFRPSFEYEIHSEGCSDPGKVPNTCGISTIKMNGVNYSDKKRGINLVAIDGKTGISYQPLKNILVYLID